MADFSYSIELFWATLYPNTLEAAKQMTLFMESNDGSNKMQLHHFAAVKAQIKKAGWSISKQRPSKMTSEQEDALMDELAV